jgi:flagellar assembly protein FliH
MSSSAEYGGAVSSPISSLQYRDISTRKMREAVAESESEMRIEQEMGGSNHPETSVSEEQLLARIERERAEAAAETEQHLRREFEQKLVAARAPVAALISSFEEQRTHYYAQVEAEIVQLALSIAAKILHREAQVDPMLLTALVRVAIEKMREGSSITVRVAPGRGASWKRYFAAIVNLAHVEVTEDAQLREDDCMLDTELGTANFSLDAQLKEVEQGFFDLLALRPANG